MTHLRRIAPLVASLAVLAPAAAAHAAPPWSAPTAVPGGIGTPTALVVTNAGRALVAAPVRPATPGLPAGSATELVALGADGTPGRATGLADAGVLAATYATDRVVVAGRTVQRIPDLDAWSVSDRSHVQVAFGTGGGDLGPARGLAGTTGEQLFALAAGARGDVAVVTGRAGAGSRRLWVRRPGGSLRVVLTVSVGSRARGATVAVGPKGDLLLVWEDDHTVYARHVGPTGHAGATHRLGDGVQSNLQASIDGTGRLMVAWKTQRVDEGEAASPAVVRFATAAPGHGFGAQRTVETVGVTGTGRYVAAPGVRLVTGADGTTVLAWTGFDGAHYVARAAGVDGGHVRAAQQLSPAGVDAVLGDLTVGPAGQAVVLWRSGVAGADPAAGEGHEQVWASTRPAATAAFGAPEAVSDPAVDVPEAPVVALDPVAHRAVTAYGPLGPGTVQVAQRAPVE